MSADESTAVARIERALRREADAKGIDSRGVNFAKLAQEGDQ